MVGVLWVVGDEVINGLFRARRRSFLRSEIMDVLFSEAYAGCAACVIPTVFLERGRVVNVVQGHGTLLDQVWLGCFVQSGCTADHSLAECRDKESGWSQIVSAMVATGELQCSPPHPSLTQWYMRRYGYSCVSGVWQYGGVLVAEL